MHDRSQKTSRRQKAVRCLALALACVASSSGIALASDTGFSSFDQKVDALKESLPMCQGDRVEVRDDATRLSWVCVVGVAGNTNVLQAQVVGMPGRRNVTGITFHWADMLQKADRDAEDEVKDHIQKVLSLVKAPDSGAILGRFVAVLPPPPPGRWSSDGAAWEEAGKGVRISVSLAGNASSTQRRLSIEPSGMVAAQ